MVVLLSLVLLCTLLWLIYSIIGLIYPFRPFRTRKRAAQSLGLSAVIVIASFVAVGSIANRETSTPSKSTASVAEGKADAPSAKPEKKVACAEGTPTPPDVVAVRGTYEVRTAPAEGAEKLKNQKASGIMGEDIFHQVDNTTTVRTLCAVQGWTQVQIVSPDWLNFVKGWVPDSVLRGIEKTSDGKRVLVEEDFYWDEDTSQFKEQIVAVVNKISRENANCPNPDPGTVAKSKDRSKPGDPVFFVTCGNGADVFNLWFKPSDAEGLTTFEAVQPLSQTAAAEACEQVAKAAATNPSTVDFSRFLDLSYTPHKNGSVRLTSSFTAKNAFNLELTYDIYCFFQGNTLVEHSISEKVD